MTNPQKKKKKTEILENWKELKQKLLTTLTELRTNHKDKWAVVKPKSPSKPVKILPTHQLEKLRGSLLEKQSLLQKMDERENKELLSSSDQTKYDQLSKEIVELKKELNWQESLKRTTREQLIDDKRELQLIRQSLDQERKSNWTLQQKLKQDLIMANEKYDKLNDQLNWLRTLVRAGDINQLQELVRKDKI